MDPKGTKVPYDTGENFHPSEGGWGLVGGMGKVPFRGLVMAKIEWEVLTKVGYVI